MPTTSSGISRSPSGCPSTTCKPDRSTTTYVNPSRPTLSIVVAAMAVSHHIETQSGWSIKKFVRTARRYRTVKIQAGNQTLTAADPLPDDLRAALIRIRTHGLH